MPQNFKSYQMAKIILGIHPIRDKKTITAQKTVPAVHLSQQPISPQSLPEALVLPSQHVAGFLNHNGYSLLCAFETLLSVIDSTAATPHNRKPHEVRECGKTCPPLEIRKGTGIFAQKMCTASFLQLISKKKSLNLHHMRQQAVPPHGRVALDGLLQFG